MIRSGQFGWEDYFAPIMDAITVGGDYYLVANDFIPYIEMQVRNSAGVNGVTRQAGCWLQLPSHSPAGVSVLCAHLWCHPTAPHKSLLVAVAVIESPQLYLTILCLWLLQFNHTCRPRLTPCTRTRRSGPT
jgi:hypothetical protein